MQQNRSRAGEIVRRRYCAADGWGLSERPLRRTIDEAGTIAELRGQAALVHTDWDAHWRTDLIALTPESGPYIRLCFGAGIPIVEHLRGLRGLPDRGARFSLSR